MRRAAPPKHVLTVVPRLELQSRLEQAAIPVQGGGRAKALRTPGLHDRMAVRVGIKQGADLDAPGALDSRLRWAATAMGCRNGRPQSWVGWGVAASRRHRARSGSRQTARAETSWRPWRAVAAPGACSVATGSPQGPRGVLWAASVNVFNWVKRCSRRFRSPQAAT